MERQRPRLTRAQREQRHAENWMYARHMVDERDVQVQPETIQPVEAAIKPADRNPVFERTIPGKIHI